MNNILELIFEPALVAEMHEFGVVANYKEGDIIIDYGKYIRTMPIILNGTIKVYRMDEDGNGNEILLYYLSSNESCSMAYSCCVEAKKSEVKAIAEDDVELLVYHTINSTNGCVNIQVGKTTLCEVLIFVF
jgi:CRP/FNR family transcriptional regulator